MLKKYNEALECYDRTLELDSTCINTWNNKIYILGIFGRYDEALECHCKALEIEQEEVEVMHDTGKYIEHLKNAEPFRGLQMKVSDLEEYRVKIIGRGETAFYQQNERALLFEIIAGKGVIFKNTIQGWDNGDKVTEKERYIIIGRVSSYLKSKGSQQIIVV